MKILLMTSPTAPVREFHLSRRQIVISLIAMLMFLVGINWMIASIINQTRDTVLFIKHSNNLDVKTTYLKDSDYERKLHELQARLEEAQINLDQLAALKEKLKNFTNSVSSPVSSDVSAANTKRSKTLAGWYSIAQYLVMQMWTC